MFIFALHIQNFRSFLDMWFFPNKTLNCIIGSNNSGKSTLMTALSILLDPKAPSYREDFITRFDFHNCNTSMPIIFDVWLDKHQEENDDIMTMAFDKFSRWNIVKYNDGHPQKIEPVITEPLDEGSETKPETVIELLRIQFSATWNESTKNAEHHLSIVNEMGDCIDTFSIGLRKLIGFNLIPSNRDPLRDISLSKRGAFSRYLDDNSINPHFRKLIEVLENNKTGLLETQSIKCVIDRLKCIVASQVLGADNQDDLVSITFLNSEINKLRAESCFSIKIGNGISDGPESPNAIYIPLEYQGDGIQNLFLIITLSETIKQQAGTNHCIIALEEPEQHLEPSQVKWIYSELHNCYSKGNNQIFITSHSPALVGEIEGVNNLILLPVEKKIKHKNRIVNAFYLNAEIKKSYERNREIYNDALLGKYILIVEGASEKGFLPVAFRYLSEDASKNPIHLGLTIIEGQDRDRTFKRADELLPFNRPIHIIIDHDTRTSKTTDQLFIESKDKDYYLSCWGDSDIVKFTSGVDLETILVKDVLPEVLLEAIKEAYQDPCHDFSKDKWINECDKLLNNPYKDKIRKFFPQDPKLQFPKELVEEDDKRAFLFVLLHAPHSCKSVKEMRIIAEYLALNIALPKTINLLYNRILSWINNKTDSLKHEYLLKFNNEH